MSRRLSEGGERLGSSEFAQAFLFGKEQNVVLILRLTDLLPQAPAGDGTPG